MLHYFNQLAPALRERILGSLYGGAVGDALGAPVEFMSRAAIIQRLGPTGVSGFVQTPAPITDDTQMTLFTLEGINDWLAQPGSVLQVCIGRAYQRWLFTQSGQMIALQASELADLASHQLLCQQRAPGHTCLSALASKRHPGEMACNHSKGCSGVMRVAPLGWLGAAQNWPLANSWQAGCLSAALTHGHPLGQTAAGAMAVMVQLLCMGIDMPQAIDTLQCLARQQQAPAALCELLHAAATLPARPALPHALGEGWVAEEALAIGLYCARHAPDFAAGLCMAVNHDGDSDSTGSICGQLLGASMGRQAIAPVWRNALDISPLLQQWVESPGETGHTAAESITPFPC
jgi:ADP-ribosyl-[dinitrogen reductase] hydrolase